MKHMMQFLLAIFMIAGVSSFTHAGIWERLYVGGAAVVPVMVDINAVKGNQSLEEVKFIQQSGAINHQSDGPGYSGLVGFEVKRSTRTDFCLELQVTGANFSWDGNPVKVFSSVTGKQTGTIIVREEKQVQFHSGNAKLRFKLGLLRPSLVAGLGHMIAKNTDISSRPDRNFYMANVRHDNGVAVRLGCGLGFLILPSRFQDRVELSLSGAYVKGIAGEEVAGIAYVELGAGLTVKFL